MKTKQEETATELLKELRKTQEIGFADRSASEDDLIFGLETKEESLQMPCLLTLREADSASGVLFRDCLVDYTACTESRCIRKLV